MIGPILSQVNRLFVCGIQAHAEEKNECFFSSEIQQNQQEVTKGDVIAERIKSYGRSLVEKKDAGQAKPTDQGTAPPYKSSRFIIAFHFLI